MIKERRSILFFSICIMKFLFYQMNFILQPPSEPARERKISRFKVSVVTEPERSKLVIPEKNEDDKRDSTASLNEQEARGESESKREADFATVINTTFDSLKTTLVKQLPTGAGKVI